MTDVALDLGTATVRLLDRDGSLLDEPTVAAVDSDTGRLLCFGRQALSTGAGAAGRVRLVRPVHRGQLADLRIAEDLMAAILRSAGLTRRGRLRVLVCVHVDATAVQRRALERALDRAGARVVRFLELPLALAIGSSIAVEEPTGSMVVEIGAGTTDMAVISLGGMVTSAAVGRGAEDFEVAVRSLLARRHGLVVDPATAREVLAMVGTVDPDLPDARVEVLGRDRTTGRNHSAIVRRTEIRRVLAEQLDPVLSAAMRCITEAPPDLANDLLGSGLVLGGGGSQLHGVPERLAAATGLPVHPADRPRLTSVEGALACLDWIDGLPPAALTRRH